MSWIDIANNTRFFIWIKISNEQSRPWQFQESVLLTNCIHHIRTFYPSPTVESLHPIFQWTRTSRNASKTFIAPNPSSPLRFWETLRPPLWQRSMDVLPQPFELVLYIVQSTSYFLSLQVYGKTIHTSTDYQNSAIVLSQRAKQVLNHCIDWNRDIGQRTAVRSTNLDSINSFCRERTKSSPDIIGISKSTRMISGLCFPSHFQNHSGL